MNRYMVADNCYSSNSHEVSDNERKSTNESSLCSSFISFNSNVKLIPQLKETYQNKVMILIILDKIVSNAMKVSSAKDLKIEKYDIINKQFKKNFHRSNRDNSLSTTVTCHDILILSKKKIVCSNIIKCSNDHGDGGNSTLTKFSYVIVLTPCMIILSYYYNTFMYDKFQI